MHGFATIELKNSVAEWSAWAIDPLDPEAPAILQKRFRKWNLNPLLEEVGPLD